MKYTEYKIYTTHEGLEILQGLLSRFGVDEVSIEDPADAEDILNKKNEWEWDYVDESLLDLKFEPCLSFYKNWESASDGSPKMLSDIPEDAENRTHDAYAYRVSEKTSWEMELAQALDKLKFDALSGRLTGKSLDLGELRVELRQTDDSEWRDKWKEYFKPAKVSDTLVVKPSWEAYEAAPGEKIIEIDPETAFGTGTHETTSLCMKLMEKTGLEGKKVLDVGTGSGILAISAALLGAEEVLGIDIDPEAVEVARRNVEKNGFSGSIEIIEGDLTKGVYFKADVLLANLMADLVCRFSPDAKKHLKPGGIFISSGILCEKEEMVAKAIREAGFEIEEIREDGEWCAILARC